MKDKYFFRNYIILTLPFVLTYKNLNLTEYMDYDRHVDIVHHGMFSISNVLFFLFLLGIRKAKSIIATLPILIWLLFHESHLSGIFSSLKLLIIIYIIIYILRELYRRISIKKIIKIYRKISIFIKELIDFRFWYALLITSIIFLFIFLFFYRLVTAIQ